MPVVVAIAVVTFGIWYWVADPGIFPGFDQRDSGFGNCLPVRYGSGYQRPSWWEPSGAENGILIRGGEHLGEPTVNTIVLDKTDDYKNEPALTEVVAVGPYAVRN